MGINERGTETPGRRSEYFISRFNRVKGDIANRVRISVDQLSFEIGMQFHLGTQIAPNRDMTVPKDFIFDSGALANHLRNVAQATSSNLHATEVDEIENTEAENAKLVSAFMDASVQSGVVRSISQWMPLSAFRLTDKFWQNHLFGDTNGRFARGEVYRATFEVLQKRLN